MRVPLFKSQRQDWSGLTPGVVRPSGVEFLAKGLQNFGESLKQMQDKVQGTKDKALVLDYHNSLSKSMLLRLSENKKIKGKEALNLLESEIQYTEKERAKLNLTTKNPHLLPVYQKIYDSVALPYLSKVGTHQSQQTLSYGLNTAKEAANSIGALTQSLTPETADQIFIHLGHLAGSIKEYPELLDQETKNIVYSTVYTMAQDNPKGTKNWVNSKAPKLQQLMGDHYPSLTKAINTGTRVFYQELERTRAAASRARVLKNTEVYRDLTARFWDGALTHKMIQRAPELTGPQLTTLHNLLNQSNKGPLPEAAVDYREYSRLSTLVNDYKQIGYEKVQVESQVVNAIGRDITQSMGKALIDKLVKTKGLTYQQKQAYSLLDKARKEYLFDSSSVEGNLRKYSQALVSLNERLVTNQKESNKDFNLFVQSLIPVDQSHSIFSKPSEKVIDVPEELSKGYIAASAYAFREGFLPQLITEEDLAKGQKGITKEEMKNIDMLFTTNPQVRITKSNYKKLLLLIRRGKRIKELELEALIKEKKLQQFKSKR